MNQNRRVSWYDEVEADHLADAEEAASPPDQFQDAPEGADNSALRANDTARRAYVYRGVACANRGGILASPRAPQAMIAQDVRLLQGAQSLVLMAELAEQAPVAQPVTPAPALQPATPAPALQPATPAPAPQPATPAPALQPAIPAPALQPATPAPAPQPQVVYVERVVVMAEPYYNWREQLLGLFRSLSPEKEENSNRFKLGYVARVINPPRPHDAYFLGCKYDINTSPGVKIDSWRAAVESLIRNGQAVVTRDRTGTAIQFDSGRWKARCGISIRIVMRSLVETIGF